MKFGRVEVTRIYTDDRRGVWIAEIVRRLSWWERVVRKKKEIPLKYFSESGIIWFSVYTGKRLASEMWDHLEDKVHYMQTFPEWKEYRNGAFHKDSLAGDAGGECLSELYPIREVPSRHPDRKETT